MTWLNPFTRVKASLPRRRAEAGLPSIARSVEKGQASQTSRILPIRVNMRPRIIYRYHITTSNKSSLRRRSAKREGGSNPVAPIQSQSCYFFVMRAQQQ